MKFHRAGLILSQCALLFAMPQSSPTPSTVPTLPTLPAEIRQELPPCASLCLQQFVQTAFPASLCSSSPSLNCLCSQPSLEGFTIGEGMFRCFLGNVETGNCSPDEAGGVNFLNICSGQNSALPNTHRSLPATIIQTSPGGTTTRLVNIVMPNQGSNNTGGVQLTTTVGDDALSTSTTGDASPTSKASATSKLSMTMVITLSALPQSQSATPLSSPLPASDDSISTEKRAGIIVGGVAAGLVIFSAIVIVGCRSRRMALKKRNHVELVIEHFAGVEDWDPTARPDRDAAPGDWKPQDQRKGPSWPISRPKTFEVLSKQPRLAVTQPRPPQKAMVNTTSMAILRPESGITIFQDIYDDGEEIPPPMPDLALIEAHREKPSQPTKQAPRNPAPKDLSSKALPPPPSSPPATDDGSLSRITQWQKATTALSSVYLKRASSLLSPSSASAPAPTYPSQALMSAPTRRPSRSKRLSNMTETTIDSASSDTDYEPDLSPVGEQASPVSPLAHPLASHAWSSRGDEHWRHDIPRSRNPCGGAQTEGADLLLLHQASVRGERI
ncbi:MAG: hypothetical protein M1829_000093 [Trizodia sp. TS-e1964]|nr:MAG: hypothetical protein M1829_000093 [Trizodia sp. TS-e1964]